jgi:urease subunit alpha
MVAVENVRGGISKKSMIHNDATPDIQVDPETYRVTADGELLVCDVAPVPGRTAAAARRRRRA